MPRRAGRILAKKYHSKPNIIGVLVSVPVLWPLVMDAGASVLAGEQRPEQRQVLTNDQIQKVQERLTAARVDPGPADGVMNPRTEAAIRH